MFYKLIRYCMHKILTCKVTKQKKQKVQYHAFFGVPLKEPKFNKKKLNFQSFASAVAHRCILRHWKSPKPPADCQEDLNFLLDGQLRNFIIHGNLPSHILRKYVQSPLFQSSVAYLLQPIMMRTCLAMNASYLL